MEMTTPDSTPKKPHWMAGALLPSLIRIMLAIFVEATAEQRWAKPR